MKTITEILDEIAVKNGFDNWATAFQRSDKYDISDYHREAAEIYANQSRWISVAVRLPESFDENYIIAFRNKNKEGGIWLTDMATWTDEGWNQRNSWETVQYWQPLPEKP